MDNINKELTVDEYNKACALFEKTLTTEQKKLFYITESFLETLSSQQLSLLIQLEQGALKSKGM